ncbi:GlcNAc-PI de-N-acetylase [Serinibacter arcticus]|uniref:GlcNAc-PI de-N-acetylase n=1 Tax=Serinibacter arcticus TaxID=1655435 RepID=A0A2U1ZRF4_9MICO|nr:PIG-L deacetylase family protein [Serinibacter arcticus]PWD49567.1 GlcNAc-PI de-N-acetylase [Serinibacter arcticus]
MDIEVSLLDDSAFERVLCVVAHPDDVEYGTSCAVAAWTSRGVEVTYLLLTRGEAGIRTLAPAETAVLREREQIEGSRAVGVTDVRFLDFPDGELTPSLELRREVARVIRDVRPDVVVTGTWELESPWGLNHVDHRVAGITVVDAIRDADNPWVFTDLTEAGLEPWAARTLLVGGHGRPTHGVDVSGEPLERGIASLEAHRVYLEAIPDHPPARPFITRMTAEQGKPLGVANGVLFHAWQM